MNRFMIQLAISMIVILGGTAAIRYVRTGELLIDQLIGAGAGVLLLIASLLWRLFKR